MPTYSVQLQINVPSIGQASPVFAGIVAATMEDAITAARANVIVKPIAVQQTAP